MPTYLFVTGSEMGPDLIESGDDDWWSCSKDTQYDDDALVYVKGVGIQYEWRVVSDAQRRDDRRWKYTCDVAHVKTFDPPITLRELLGAFRKDEWAAPYMHFKGYSSIVIPDEVASQIMGLRA